MAAPDLYACAERPHEAFVADGASLKGPDTREEGVDVTDPGSDPDPNLDSDPDQAPIPTLYPTGWLVKEAEGVPAGTALQILYTPDIAIAGHRNGASVDSGEQERQRELWPDAEDDESIIEYDGRIVAVSADWLMMNLPDIMPDAKYDIVYSYAATSRCAEREIPGVTNEQLPGYAEGKQDNLYLSKPQYYVPCAYQTALKAKRVNDALGSQGMRLLVYDAYRPVTAQVYLSNAFETAIWNDSIMQESLGDWSLAWYVASGPSGHNYGTALDVGVCDARDNPIDMPSPFDAFDESGHLTQRPMTASDIAPGAYRDAVLSNEACMALHAAFTEEGFSELASEWWHFADKETEAAMREIVGDGGLDFVA